MTHSSNNYRQDQKGAHSMQISYGQLTIPNFLWWFRCKGYTLALLVIKANNLQIKCRHRNGSQTEQTLEPQWRFLVSWTYSILSVLSLASIFQERKWHLADISFFQSRISAVISSHRSLPFAPKYNGIQNIEKKYVDNIWTCGLIWLCARMQCVNMNMDSWLCQAAMNEVES